jgi:hypothetical protein
MEKNKVICLFLFFMVLPLNLFSQGIVFSDTDPEIITVNNGAYYEIAFFKSNGSIAFIKDISSDTMLIEGNENFPLWQIVFEDNTRIFSNDFVQTGDKTWIYNWNDQEKALVLEYHHDQSIVKVNVIVNDMEYFDMDMEVTNKWNKCTYRIGFPDILLLNMAENNTAVLPEHFPGMMLFPEFFKQSKHFTYSYPDVFSADYVSINFETSSLCLYSLNYDKKILLVEFGFEPNDDPGFEHNYHFKHQYKKWLKADSTWNSPVSRFWIGKSTIETLRSYRNDNKINEYPSVRDKLGDQFDTIASSPLLQHHYHIFPDPLSFNDLPDLINQYPGPLILMITAYFTGGYHGYHPDYLPPEPLYGTTEDFKDMVKSIQSQGKKVILFTLPTWWHTESPTIKGLNNEALLDAVAIKEDGSPNSSGWYLDGEWAFGFNVSPYSPYVHSRLDNMFNEVFVEYGADMIYEDVLGVTGIYLDFNPNSPNPDAYTQGWLNFAESKSQYLSMAEKAYDRMGEYMFSSIGESPISGFPTLPAHWDYESDKIIWQPYPCGPVIYGDKMASYFWNPNGQDIRLENISYSLIFGSPLTKNTTNGITFEEANNDHVFQLMDFQEYVGSRIYGRQMNDYTGIPGKVTTADYGDITLTTNWDNEQSHTVDNHIIPPHGIYIKSDDDSLIAGTFTSFNGEELEFTNQDNPEKRSQYIIQLLDENKITIRHPKGLGTPITIKRPASWTDDIKIEVREWTPFDKRLINYDLDHQSIKFYIDEVSFPDTLSWYEITYGVISGNNRDTEITESLQVYPNPADSFIKLEGDLKDYEYAYMVNLMGIVVKKVRINGNNPEINISDLPSGIYVLRIGTTNTMVIKK